MKEIFDGVTEKKISNLYGTLNIYKNDLEKSLHDYIEIGNQIEELQDELYYLNNSDVSYKIDGDTEVIIVNHTRSRKLVLKD